MAEESTAAPNSERAPPASGGRWLAVLALIIGLAATFGIAYLYYNLAMHNPTAGIAERLAGLQTAQERLASDLRRLAGERQAALAAFRSELEKRQRASEKELAESLRGLTAPDFPPERTWKLAEVEFLLRTANNRTLFERDAVSALELLRSADDILDGLTDPAAHGLRATIAAEVLRLEQADIVEPSAIYLRLDAIKHRLTGQVFAPRDYAAAGPAPATFPRDEAAPPVEGSGKPVADGGFAGEAEPQPPEPGFFATLGRELARIVRFRRIDTTLERPPTPVESGRLEISLRLMLEQAQLAALRRNQAVYDASLGSALDWSRALLGEQDAGTREIIDALETLRRMDLEAPLPDISGSLTELLEARRKRP